jgi:hypothetical protein
MARRSKGGEAESGRSLSQPHAKLASEVFRRSPPGHDAGMSEHDEQTEQTREEREESERRETEILEHEQEHKGFGEDEGEREESLPGQ